MHALGLPQVLDQGLAPVPPLLLVEGLAPQARRDLVKLLVLNGKWCC